jgi:small-conductance mechanosensitive channel
MTKGAKAGLTMLKSTALAVLLAVVMSLQGVHAQTTPAPADAAPAEQAGPSDQGASGQVGTAVTTTTTPAATPAQGGNTVVVSKGAGRNTSLDYAEWERAADRAEEVLANPDADSRVLDSLRAQIVDWRAAFLVAQNTNSTRIATLRDQIAALGPVPAEGETEASEIAQRRQQLSDQLVRLQAPGIAAEEAYRRADGLIGEVDRILRERQANQLLQLWPSPINPANWPEALVVLRDVTVALWTETTTRWARGNGRQDLFDNLPLILLLAVVGLGLMSMTQRILVPLQQRLPKPKTARGRRVVSLMISLLHIIFPTMGALALTEAVILTNLIGPVGTAAVLIFPAMIFTIYAANWLGTTIFPFEDGTETSGIPVPERRAEGRFLARSIGLVLGIEALRQAILLEITASDTANAVLGFPLLATMAVLIFRMGQLLRRHVRSVGAGDESLTFGLRVLGLLARGVMLTGLAGVLLGAVGYIAAATALVFPSVISLGLVAVLFVAQRLVGDLYGLATKSDAADQEGLIPVLIGFAMTLASIPLFALVWGARLADITELWQRFLTGFQIGSTRVSPTDFLFFAVIFAVGYMLTRLFQGALRGSVLPRTTLDQGGQNAIVSGVGYIGIFLAALLAINFAGIDLSGLAIVAGALSVGIGFGLQNIVSNFVSGIILLIERPVSEGDWIEVGQVTGTVKSISVRSTRIQTFDRSDVIVPNADLVTQQVTNWTRYNLSGRLIVPVSVAFGTDTRKVERVLREIAEAQPLAVLNPPPMIAFMGFGADAMNFEIRMILRDVNFSLSVRTEVNHQIIERFEAEGIEIPFAQTEVYLRNVDALGRALRGLTPAVDLEDKGQAMTRNAIRAQTDKDDGEA